YEEEPASPTSFAHFDAVGRGCRGAGKPGAEGIHTGLGRSQRRGPARAVVPGITAWRRTLSNAGYSARRRPPTSTRSIFFSTTTRRAPFPPAGDPGRGPPARTARSNTLRDVARSRAFPNASHSRR